MSEYTERETFQRENASDNFQYRMGVVDNATLSVPKSFIHNELMLILGQ